MNYHSSGNISSATSKRILIVENDKELIDVYSTRLGVEGFIVESLKDGNEVYQKVVEFKPDMVLLDIRLGSTDGLDVLQELRNHTETKNTKVIVITVLALDAVEDRAKKLGALEYLVKTTTILADIVEHIKEHLGMVSPLEEEMIEELSPNTV
jgi:CheY-like chemotaxis protein